MPGSGLNASTLPTLLRALLPLGVREIHLSGGEWVPSEMEYRRDSMGMGAGEVNEWSVWRTSEEKVRAAREVCDAIWKEFENNEKREL